MAGPTGFASCARAQEASAIAIKATVFLARRDTSQVAGCDVARYALIILCSLEPSARRSQWLRWPTTIAPEFRSRRSQAQDRSPELNIPVSPAGSLRGGPRGSIMIKDGAPSRLIRLG